MFNITDTVNGAFETDALIHLGSSLRELAGDYTGQEYRPNYARSKRSVEQLTDPGEGMITELIPIDELMSGIKVVLTVKPAHLAPLVRLEKPLDGYERYCRATKISRTTDSTGSVVFDVVSDDCTCTGDWRLMLPRGSKYQFSAKSLGDSSLGLEAYFVDNAAMDRQVSSFSPCIGVPETLVVKIHQERRM